MPSRKLRVSDLNTHTVKKGHSQDVNVGCVLCGLPAVCRSHQGSERDSAEFAGEAQPGSPETPRSGKGLGCFWARGEGKCFGPEDMGENF